MTPHETVVSVAVGNVCNNPPMPQEHVVEDVELLHSMGQVVLACEIGRRRYDQAFKAAAEAKGRRAFFEKSAVQVSVPAFWEKKHGLSREKHRLSLGLKGVNPSRWMNVVKDEDRKLAFASIHLTNGAWNPKPKPFKKWRQRTWLKQERRARRIVGALNREGYTVVIGGDVNCIESPFLNHAQETVATASKIIHLIVVPAPGVRVEALDIKKRDGHSDHNFLRATLVLTHTDREGI